jgi:hypothetical protein
MAGEEASGTAEARLVSSSSASSPGQIEWVERPAQLRHKVIR